MPAEVDSTGQPSMEILVRYIDLYLKCQVMGMGLATDRPCSSVPVRGGPGSVSMIYSIHMPCPECRFGAQLRADGPYAKEFTINQGLLTVEQPCCCPYCGFTYTIRGGVASKLRKGLVY